MASGSTSNGLVYPQSRSAGGLGGGRGTLEDIWQENRRWIAAVILAHKPQEADLDDLLQDVAMTLVAKIGTIRDHASVRGWLRTVAINAARAEGRATRLRPRAHEDVDRHAAAKGVTETSDVPDQSRHVLWLTEQLPEEYREPLMLKAQGLRSRQIAELLGINEATVDTRVSRARRMLRELSEKESVANVPANGVRRNGQCS